MSRGKQAPKRVISPDPQYGSELVSKFTNYLMIGGKKTIAQSIVYGAMEDLAKRRGGNPLELFEQVINTVKPHVEVRSRRVGGANYQVPMPVAGNRQSTLAFRWILTATRARRGKAMQARLADEFNDILEGTGGAMKKREDVHRQAEANKAFAHFARFGSR
jgi:small subunit ribosomal protein S7